MNEEKARIARTRRGLSDRIRRARRTQSLSQAELARRLGIHRAAVTQWERPDGTLPSTLNLLQAAIETGVSFEWLATGRGSMSAPEFDAPAFSTECIARSFEEEALLGSFRRLTHRQQEALLLVLDAMGGGRATV
jgi:transcriptional regulator with XRE-family HTH domain